MRLHYLGGLAVLTCREVAIRAALRPATRLYSGGLTRLRRVQWAVRRRLAATTRAVRDRLPVLTLLAGVWRQIPRDSAAATHRWLWSPATWRTVRAVAWHGAVALRHGWDRARTQFLTKCRVLPLSTVTRSDCQSLLTEFAAERVAEAPAVWIVQHTYWFHADVRSAKALVGQAVCAEPWLLDAISVRPEFEAARRAKLASTEYYMVHCLMASAIRQVLEFNSFPDDLEYEASRHHITTEECLALLRTFIRTGKKYNQILYPHSAIAKRPKRVPLPPPPPPPRPDHSREIAARRATLSRLEQEIAGARGLIEYGRRHPKALSSERIDEARSRLGTLEQMFRETQHSLSMLEAAQ